MGIKVETCPVRSWRGAVLGYNATIKGLSLSPGELVLAVDSWDICTVGLRVFLVKVKLKLPVKKTFLFFFWC